MNFLRVTAAWVLAWGMVASGQTAPATPGGAQSVPGRPVAQGRATRGAIDIYFIDVEGGNATLFVGPDGESLLVDTGYSTPDERDAKRIAAICKLAGVTKIDNLVMTHYHEDHAGGVSQLIGMVPVGRFIDHGINRETATQPGGSATVAAWDGYQKALESGHAQHLVVKPGDVLPVKFMRVDVISADGEVIAKPLQGAGEQNAACASSPEKDPEGGENDRSVGMLMTFGRLRILDPGDLSWAKERPLMCPVNKVGKVDLYIVSHHGTATSGSPALVLGIDPRVAVMANGPRKGGSAATFDILEGLPRLRDLWQLHTAEANDAKHNMADARIANLPGPDAANYLKVTARADGTLSVMNSRTSEVVEYPAK